jgi:hypothetical protein
VNAWIVAAAILVGSGAVAGAILLRPSPFRECIGIISADIVHRNLTATLDPRDVEVEAAKVCAGAAL